MLSTVDLDRRIVEAVTDRTGQDVVLLCEALEALRNQQRIIRTAFMALSYNADKTSVMDVLAEGIKNAQKSPTNASRP